MDGDAATTQPALRDAAPTRVPPRWQWCWLQSRTRLSDSRTDAADLPSRRRRHRCGRGDHPPV